jgi:hypothetical protein
MCPALLTPPQLAPCLALPDQRGSSAGQDISADRSVLWPIADAILVNAPTLGGGNLLQGISALFSGLSRRKDGRREIGVARIDVVAASTLAPQAS